MEDIKAPEKTSAWTEAERERVVEHVCGLQGYQRGLEPDPPCPGCVAEREEPTGPPPPTPLFTSESKEPPAPPPWIQSFFPGTVITHGGWEAVVRHVGEQEGHWLVLLEPTQPTGERKGPSRGVTRAEYRSLKRMLGKKGARKKLAARRAATAVAEALHPEVADDSQRNDG